MRRIEVEKASRAEMARMLEEYRQAMQAQREADQRRWAEMEENHRRAKEEWEEQVRTPKEQ